MSSWAAASLRRMLYVRSLPPVSSGSSLPGFTHKIFMVLLPADSLVCAIFGDTPRLFKVDEIDDDLIGMDVLAEGCAVEAARGNDHHFRCRKRKREIPTQERSDVGNHILDVLPIGPDQMTKGDVVVPDLQIAPFAQ